MPIYVHTPWFNKDRLADLRKFVGEGSCTAWPPWHGGAPSMCAQVGCWTAGMDALTLPTMSPGSPAASAAPCMLLGPCRVHAVFWRRVLGKACRAAVVSPAAAPSPAGQPCMRHPNLRFSACPAWFTAGDDDAAHQLDEEPNTSQPAETQRCHVRLEEAAGVECRWDHSASGEQTHGGQIRPSLTLAGAAWRRPRHRLHPLPRPWPSCQPLAST